MQTLEIPPRDWAQCLNEFTLIHDGWLVSLDVLNPDLGAQTQILNLPLLGISVDRLDHDPGVVISVGRWQTEHLTHIVHDVTHIYIERTCDGADAALELESADGTKTILRFRVAALPETVDGMMRPRPS